MAKRKQLSETIGFMAFDNLIDGIYPPAELFTVKIATGQGVLERGTLLANIDGRMFAAGTATGGNVSAILAENIDTGALNDVNAPAYRTGCFNAAAIKTVDGYDITAEQKMRLRSVGIVISGCKKRSVVNASILGKMIIGITALHK